MTNNKSNTNLKPKIKSAFRQAGGYVTRKDIGKAIRLRREDRPEFDRIIAAMIARGELREKEDKLMLAEKPGYPGQGCGSQGQPDLWFCQAR